MSIQWFPGHMVSAKKKARETLANIDVIIEVLDARLPAASRNPMIDELRKERQRACLKILNKADLADPKITAEWLHFFNAERGVKAIAMSCKNVKEATKIPKLCEALAPHRDSNVKPLRMMIMGIPNVGKSTLMNALVKRRIAKVGDEPAVTKMQQMHQLDVRHFLTDTPGLMWPKIAYEIDGFMLAASHAIGRNAVEESEVARPLADILLRRYADNLAARYGFSHDHLAAMDAQNLIEKIAEKRAMRMKGGAFDLEKASVLFLQDYREGKLGAISLESPESRQQMIDAQLLRQQEAQ